MYRRSIIFMGGIRVNSDSCTSMENLYAVGETSCTGVHGKNRLASNSLLECVVFGKQAAKHIQKGWRKENMNKIIMELQMDHLIREALRKIFPVRM